MIDTEGSVNIPTILYYDTAKKIHIGSSALAAARRREQLNEDFKIELGNIDQKARLRVKRNFLTASNEYKSALGLTSDFVHQLLQSTHQWLMNNGLERSASIFLAEPLSMQSESVSADWLSNYRKNLESIMLGEGYTTVDFLPEPFAVFQYYRYGVRHPIVAGANKICALVIDFGGGTFDVCIIETTSKGDISQTGRNSRPLAASSQPFGGFYINRAIAEELLLKHCVSKVESTMLKKGFALYKEWRKGTQDFATVAKEYLTFVEKLHAMTYEIENPKLALCKLIMDWRLDATLNIQVPINIPKSPFSPGSDTVSVNFSANELREIFVNKVWNMHLKPVVGQALQRGREELSGVPISVVLLSGGSANIRWLQELMRRDFAADLRDAEIIQLPDFQEVVSKGLAVECTRRFYTEKGGGDFSSVTYNRLCLVLNSDERGHVISQFRPRTKGLPDVAQMPGVLLPSASTLRSFIDVPMRWRFRLERPPHKQLDYYFLRSSIDPGDLDNLQNVVDHRAFTPSDFHHFDANLHLELLVRKDGTAIPRFIYSSGQTEADTTAITARPFFLDMTYTHPDETATAYLGLDFGSSNTSVSFVDRESVHIFQKRSMEKRWSDLNELCSTLPYPLAEPLCRYLGQSDPRRLTEKALEFLEAALSLGAYVTFLDYCSLKGNRESSLFKGYTKRSAGPLWGFLKQCLKALTDKGSFSSPYKELLRRELFEQIDRTVNSLADFKHGKLDPEKVETLRAVQILANISREVFRNTVFGYFEQVRKQKFGNKYEGIFRCAQGNPPFTDMYFYEGPADYSPEQPLLVNLDSMEALSLLPLIFWDNCEHHRELDNGHCNFFDIEEAGNVFSFKAVGYTCACKVSTSNRYQPLANMLSDFRKKDPKIEILKIGKLAPPR
jgi:molecular chaperone DnaK (HSP70)